MTWAKVWKCHIKDYLLALEQGISAAKIKIGKYRNVYLVQARLRFSNMKLWHSKVLNVYKDSHLVQEFGGINADQLSRLARSPVK